MQTASKTTHTPPKQPYDAIVVGSGAAGGMAAFQLATAGLKVLVLEAGAEADTRKVFKTMEWPYQAQRRGRLEPGEHAITAAEYNMLDRPYGTAKALAKHDKVYSYGGNRYTSYAVVNEKEHPFTGTPYAWVRARVLGGKTMFWGRVALRLSDYDFKAKTHDGYGDDWPLSYTDVAPYYDKVDLLLGISGTKEGLPQLPDSIFQRPLKLNQGEVLLKRAIAKMGRHLIPGRAGVTTDGLANNKYRFKCMGRGRCGRGCDLHSAFHSPTALLYPARDTGNLDIRTGSIVSEVLLGDRPDRVRGVRVIDAATREVFDYEGKVVVLAASTLETTRLLLNSRSAQAPNGLANSSGLVGHHFCEHVMGPRASGFLPQLKGNAVTLDDGRPQSAYIARFRNLTDRHSRFIRGYGFQGGSGCAEYPSYAPGVQGFGSAWKAKVRELYPTPLGIAGFGEVLARYENQVAIDPETKDAWGVPTLKFSYRFADNERAMVQDMADTAEEMLRAVGAEDVTVRREALTEGWSIHELGTARMGADPKASVTNSFGQTHEVRNLFLADGSVFVSAGCQNPTWTIMALCWRGMDYLKEGLKRGEV